MCSFDSCEAVFHPKHSEVGGRVNCSASNEMPPKKKQSCKQGATPSEECCICCQPVTLGKDEALFCVGSCQQWLHRYCASVSAQRYQAITGDSSPFLCPNCCCEQQKEQIAVLTMTSALHKFVFIDRQSLLVDFCCVLSIPVKLFSIPSTLRLVEE